ncbi:MAG: hypothetical protein KGJ34_02315 [Patescibacteria group bacterium]|nr:hypothetical protein [Patescibacteria group bacterium]
MKKPLVWVSIIVGILFVLLALYYWMTPAESLPTYLPGYIAGDTAPHFKHGLASLIVGLAFFVFAWFQSGPHKA